MRSLMMACAAALLLGGYTGCAKNLACCGTYNKCDTGCGCGPATSAAYGQPCAGGNCQTCASGNCRGKATSGAYQHAGFGGSGDFYGNGCPCGGMGGAGCRGCALKGAGHQDGGPSGPQTATVGYPYYTLRGPRDFLLNNPPTIGP